MTAHYRRILFFLALLFCFPTISSSQDHPSIHEEQLEEQMDIFDENNDGQFDFDEVKEAIFSLLKDKS